MSSVVGVVGRPKNVCIKHSRIAPLRLTASLGAHLAKQNVEMGGVEPPYELGLKHIITSVVGMGCQQP